MPELFLQLRVLAKTNSISCQIPYSLRSGVVVCGETNASAVNRQRKTAAKSFLTATILKDSIRIMDETGPKAYI